MGELVVGSRMYGVGGDHVRYLEGIFVRLGLAMTGLRMA